MKKYLLAFLAVISVFPLSAQVKLPKDFDAYIESVRKAFEVPGLAVGIVKDGKVVLVKGYGEKKLGGPEKVDEHTLFGIASNTKIFTATALAMLVEEGKLKWDAPVVNYLPWFQMSDPFVTREMTVRDLLVHRSGLGLGAGDLLWWPPSNYSRKEIAARLKYLPLVTSFRTAYAYDNVLYLVAGEVIESVSGLRWEEFISTRILAPLSMTESSPHYVQPSPANNVAYPHAPVEGTVKTVKPFDSNNTNPAGGINSSVSDMTKWIILQMDSGKLNQQKRLFQRSTTNELWSIVTPYPISTVPKVLAPLQPNFSGYALGLNARDYRGKKILTHTGGLPGYLSRVAMIPELKGGVIVLTNQESGAAFDAITFYVLDYLLGAPSFDWLGAYKQNNERVRKTVQDADTKAASQRNSKSSPSLLLTSYAGSYQDAWYGDIDITMSNDVLEIQFSHTPSLKGKLEHWQYDTFVVRWYDRELRADAYITFNLNPDGTIEKAKMKAVSPSVDFSFDFQDLTLLPKR